MRRIATRQVKEFEIYVCILRGRNAEVSPLVEEVSYRVIQNLRRGRLGPKKYMTSVKVLKNLYWSELRTLLLLWIDKREPTGRV